MIALPWVLAAATTLGAGAVPPDSPGDVVVLNSEMRVRAVGGRDLVLEVRVAPGDSRESIARRVARSPRDADAVGTSRDAPLPAPGTFVAVPFEVLSDDLRSVVLRNVFPRDRMETGAWIHVPGAGRLPLFDEGLWQVALWFVGDGGRFREVQKANGLDSPELFPGRAIRIPVALLHASLRPGPTSDDGSLVYGKDDQGEFAGYRLRPGEALYSAVVVRFTGTTSTEDVEATAKAISRRSGIRDPRDIPVDWLVKIPFDLLEPDFLPAGHPRRKRKEAEDAAVKRELAERPPAEARDRHRGVLVILDPGHGGQDLGTSGHGVWEHDYVYDVACRLKAILQHDTAAEVALTLEDAENGCEPSAGDALSANREGTLKTDPPFLADGEGETAVAVNLRWYLANSLYRRALRRGIHPDRVVFVSLHADSRHPSLRGVMVYVPGSAYRSGTYGFTSPTYLRFAEVREKPRIRFSSKERLRSEAVSRELAADVVKAFSRRKLPVQQFQPVRERVIRGGRPWLPAVLRGNAVPTKLLIEMVNLANRDDASLLAHAPDRERMAAAVADALEAHYAASRAPTARKRTRR